MELHGILAIVIASVIGMLVLARIAYKLCQALMQTIVRYALVHVIYPRLFVWKHPSLFNPTRAETLLYAVHLGITIFSNVYRVASTAEAGVRAAQLAVVHLAPLLAFRQIHWLATLLGIRLSTFSKFHRALGLMATAQTVIHSVIAMQGANLSKIDSIFGMLCLTSVVLLTFLPMIRHLAYEIFLRSHLILTIVLAIFLWEHLELKGRLSRMLVLCASAVLACVTIVQWIAQLYANLNIGWDGLGLVRVVKAEVYGPTTVLQLSMGRSMSFVPGQYVLLSLMTLRFGSFWQRHPFTIAWWESSRSNARRQSLWLVVRRKKGWTAHLAKAAATIQDCPAWIRGPYGQALDLSKYGYVLMFASGDGIFAQLPLIKALIDRSRMSDARTRRVKLVWQTDGYPDQLQQWMQSLLDSEDIDGQLLDISMHRTTGATGKTIERLGNRLREVKDVPNIDNYVGSSISKPTQRVAIVVSTYHRLREDIRRRVLATEQLNLDLINLEFQPEEEFSNRGGTAA